MRATRVTAVVLLKIERNIGRRILTINQPRAPTSPSTKSTLSSDSARPRRRTASVLPIERARRRSIGATIFDAVGINAICAAGRLQPPGRPVSPRAHGKTLVGNTDLHLLDRLG
jgi:hypothetical protein